MADITLVFGPPGTGKTHWLQENASTMVALDSSSRDDMLAVSFSNAAAQVLQSRMGIDNERAGTIHSFGRHYLESAPIADAPPSRGSTENKLVQAWNDWAPQWSLSFTGQHNASGEIDQLGVGPTASGQGNAILNLINLFRHCMYPEDEWKRRAVKHDYVVHSSILDFWHEWKRFKARESCIDFTDMIEIPLRDRAPIPFGASIVYTDEAQDNTPLIMARVLQFAELMDDYGQLFIALDDDQTIYGHLGCNPAPILALQGVARVHLDQSYRMPQAVHEYSQRWIKRVQVREPKDFLPAARAGELVFSDATMSRVNESHAHRVATDVLKELEQRDRTVMLLATTNLMAGQLVATLRDAGIPFHNPNRPKNGQWNPLRGNSVATTAILSWAKAMEGTGWTNRDVYRMSKFIKTSTILKNATSLATRFEKMSEEEKDREIDDAFIKREFKSYDALADLSSGDPAILRELLPMVGGKQRGSYNLKIWESLGRAGLTSQPRVTVGTIHSVKGDEVDTVMLFPDLSKAAHSSLSNPDKTERDHVIRTFYVGMTRARDKLAVYSGQPRGYWIRLPRE